MQSYSDLLHASLEQCFLLAQRHGRRGRRRGGQILAASYHGSPLTAAAARVAPQPRRRSVLGGTARQRAITGGTPWADGNQRKTPGNRPPGALLLTERYKTDSIIMIQFQLMQQTAGSRAIAVSGLRAVRRGARAGRRLAELTRDGGPGGCGAAFALPGDLPGRGTVAITVPRRASGCHGVPIADRAAHGWCGHGLPWHAVASVGVTG